MDVTVKTKNCEVPARVQEETVERVRHATRVFDRLLDVEVVFTAERAGRGAGTAAVEVTARTKGHHIRAEGVADDHRAAADAAVTRFERQLARYKSRLVDRSQGRTRSTAAVGGIAGQLGEGPSRDSDDDRDGFPRIVRTKHFDVRPMLPEDAALQLDLLGHDFFLFTNAATGDANVIYRRRDGQLGLIEPVTPSDQVGAGGGFREDG